MVKNLPSYAEDAGSIPGPVTKIPHAAGQSGLYVPQLEKATHYIKELAHQKGRRSAAKKQNKTKQKSNDNKKTPILTHHYHPKSIL